MKKVLLIIATILLSVSIIGCSSSSKKYDDDINKIIDKMNKNLNDDIEKYNREKMNIEVYDDVQLNTERVQGKFRFYKFYYKKENENNKHKWYVITSNGEVESISDSEIDRIGLPKVTYEEINNKELNK